MSASYLYEIHLTVRTTDIPRFRAICDEVGVKAIVIDLQDKTGGNVMMDVMTSSKFSGTDGQAYQQAQHLKQLIQIAGLDVVRTKIETVPWHLLASDVDIENMVLREGRYFEAHIPVLLTANDGEQSELLTGIATGRVLHRSRNALKVVSDEQTVVMLTRRSKSAGAYAFEFVVGLDVDALKHAGFNLAKPNPEIEFALFDSNVHHDLAWIKA